MKFFIDTANLDQIREAYDMGVLDGVTTNPSLMAKEGIKGVENQRKHYVDICNIVQGDVSAEVIATDYEGMIKEGEELAALNPHIVVKVPCIADGIKAIKYFSGKGIRTNCTLVFSIGQALLAAKAGATYVSPFVGRLDDISEDGIALVGKIPLLWLRYPGACGFHPPYGAYHPVHRGRGGCSYMSAFRHKRTAESSADGRRIKEVPGRL